MNNEKLLQLLGTFRRLSSSYKVGTKASQILYCKHLVKKTTEGHNY